MNSLVIIATILLSITLASCSFEFVHEYDDEEEDFVMERIFEIPWRLSESSNKFGFNLHNHLVAEKASNLIFSPISVSTILGLLYYGSRGNTEKELETILAYPDYNLTRLEVAVAFKYLLHYHLVTDQPRAYTLDLATAIFANNLLRLNSTYQKDAVEFFRSPLEVFDSATGGSKAMNRINEWVRNRTRDKVCSIIDYIDPSADLITVNALYFKSRWISPFLEKNTKLEMFYNEGKFPKLVAMMRKENTFLHYENDELSLVHIIFWGRNISMVILLPHHPEGLPELEKSITQENFSHYVYKAIPKMVELKLPKFNLSFSSDLVPILNRMGAKDVFQPSEADLSGIFENANVAMGEVRHKATIEVNEAGVEASGVTSAISFKSMTFPEDYDTKFYVDHPFMFIILDERTELALLMGRVWNL